MLNKTIVEIHIEFRGIDHMNRPVFKQVGRRVYYGSTSKLFNVDTPKEEVITYFENHLEELEYFGSTFPCEPHGGLPEYFKLLIKTE